MGFSLNRGFIISQPCKEGGVCCGTRMPHRSHGSLPQHRRHPLKAQVAEIATYVGPLFFYPFLARVRTPEPLSSPTPTNYPPNFSSAPRPLKTPYRGLYFSSHFSTNFCVLFSHFYSEKREVFTPLFFLFEFI